MHLNKIAVLGESNSVMRNGWVDGLRQAMPDSNIKNYSIGSTGIFNAFYQIDQLGDNLTQYDLILIDSFINDSIFFKDSQNLYITILRDLILYIKTRNIYCAMVLFEPIDNRESETLKYAIVQLLRQESIPLIFVNNWIHQYSKITKISFEDMYSDNVHLKRNFAFHFGKQLGLQLVKKNFLRSANYSTSISTLTNFYSANLFLPDHLQRKKIKNNLVDCVAVKLSCNISVKIHPDMIGKKRLLGIIYNASQANGYIHFESNSESLFKNFSNRNFMSEPLIWGRPFHNSFMLGKDLKMSLTECPGEEFPVESTEWSHSSFYVKNRLPSFELIGLLVG